MGFVNKQTDGALKKSMHILCLILSWDMYLIARGRSKKVFLFLASINIFFLLLTIFFFLDSGPLSGRLFLDGPIIPRSSAVYEFIASVTRKKLNFYIHVYSYYIFLNPFTWLFSLFVSLAIFVSRFKFNNLTSDIIVSQSKTKLWLWLIFITPILIALFHIVRLFIGGWFFHTIGLNQYEWFWIFQLFYQVKMIAFIWTIEIVILLNIYGYFSKS